MQSRDLGSETRPLAEATLLARELVGRAPESRTPVVLTLEGNPELVVVDAAEYRKDMEQLEHYETVQAIREGLAAAEQGRMRPAGEALEELGQRLGFSG